MFVLTVPEDASLAARSCSAVKACPQILHLQVEFGFRSAAREPNRPFALEWNAMTSSPPHSRHCRCIAILLPRVYVEVTPKRHAFLWH
jgi:hypothetical protein